MFFDKYRGVHVGKVGKRGRLPVILAHFRTTAGDEVTRDQKALSKYFNCPPTGLTNADKELALKAILDIDQEILAFKSMPLKPKKKKLSPKAQSRKDRKGHRTQRPR